jgi:putative transposase
MKRSKFTEEQIINILKESEAGKKTADICREHGISAWTFYDWRKKYKGMSVPEARRLKKLEEENRRLKTMVADLSLDNVGLKDLLSKKW